MRVSLAFHAIGDGVREAQNGLGSVLRQPRGEKGRGGKGAGMAIQGMSRPGRIRALSVGTLRPHSVDRVVLFRLELPILWEKGVWEYFPCFFKHRQPFGGCISIG